ncbi:MAG: rhodanese-like domain-containing protein [Phototrophicaceae bacterium]
MMKRFLVPIALLLSVMLVSACSSATTSELIAPDAYISQFSESDASHILIDVRTASEFANGHIAGAVNIPVEEIASRLDEIPADMPIVVYCQSGNRSGQASNILANNNYSEIYDLGGIARWTSQGYPVE